MVYKRKNWAKIVLLLLFSLALLGALAALGTLETPLINKVPLFVGVFVYSMAIYHFGFAESFKEFFRFQNIEITAPLPDSKEIMESEKFWKIMEITKSESSGNYEKQQSRLEKELLKLTANEVLEFDNKFKNLKRRNL